MPDLSDSVNWSEIDANNNQAPPNGWPEGMMPSGVNDAARADRGALKRFWNKVNPVQTITPSGNLWTFTTGNVMYPAAYVPGELYCFYPSQPNTGGDQFQVNALGAKPILKHLVPGTTTWVPLIAYDIRAGHAVQLVYDPAQNAGSGAFIMQNPVLPLQNDGTGFGIVVPGALIINENTGPPPPIWAGGVSALVQLVGSDTVNPALVIDAFSTTGMGVPTLGFRSARGSLTGGLSYTRQNDSMGNIAWRGHGTSNYSSSAVARILCAAQTDFSETSQPASLQFSTTQAGTLIPSTQAVIGPGLTVGAPTAPGGGMLVGDINAQRVFCQGQLVAVTSSDGSSNVTGNASVGGTLNVTGASTYGDLGTFNNGLTVHGHLGGYGDAYFTGNITTEQQLNVDNGLNVVGGDTVLQSTNIYGTGLQINSGGLHCVPNVQFDNNLAVTGNVTVGGTLNGHPAIVLDTLIEQIAALTAKVTTLEAQVHALQR